jgi:hypothetical protein
MDRILGLRWTIDTSKKENHRIVTTTDKTSLRPRIALSQVFPNQAHIA